MATRDRDAGVMAGPEPEPGMMDRLAGVLVGRDTSGWDNVEDLASAVLIAMREPTEGILVAADYPIGTAVKSWMKSHDWPLMIDAALEGK
jgi:hypothetical protein